VSLDAERAVLAGELGALLGVAAEEVERAIMRQHEAYLPHKRSLVSTMASAAWLAAMLHAMSNADRHAWLSGADATGGTRLDKVLSGHVSEIAGSLTEFLAGPYDVPWDGNWPHELAARHLRGRMPANVRPGDVVVGGDGGGVRIDIRVIADESGVMTGDVLDDTWRDPPFEDIWLATYKRLEELFPAEVPPPG
jgi:hypothetical protein